MGKSNGLVGKKTVETKRIEAALQDRFSSVNAYRYNSASIRVRVVDEAFQKLSRTRREEMVQPILEGLPAETQADIMILLLLSPDEVATSPMNIEFEHPTPSQV